MKTLSELNNKYKIGDWPDRDSVHSYLPVYEEILASYRMTAMNVLEIGLMSGQSLRMWDEYFNDDLRSTPCNVYGIDCDLKPINGQADLTGAIADGLNIVIGDASNPAVIDNWFKGIKFDFICEDANHDIEQQLKIYDTLKHYLNEGAIYVIEDVQNIDQTRNCFKSLGGEKNIEIIDRRSVKGRYDDCIIIIKDK